MCGFPLMHLDRHLKTLVQTHGRNVAICEEFPRPRKIKVQVNMKVNDDGEGQGEGEVTELEPLTFERRVVRIVTPGTLIDEPFLDQHENNYLLAITVSEPATNFKLRPELGSDSATGTGAGAALQATKEPQLGLAWIDVSTGEFFSKSTTQAGIRDEIVRLTPREVVLDRSFESLPDHPLRQVLTEEQAFVSYIDDPAHSTISQKASNSDDSQDSSKLIPTGPLTINSEISTNSDDLTETSISAPSPSSKDSSQSPTAISTASTYTPSESTAIALLTSFLSTHLMEHMPTLGLPRRTAESAHMSIDASTLTALEIKARSYGNTEGSLLAAVRRTLTPGGARLLARWLCAPSTSLPEIAARQAAVALFHSRPHLRVDLRQVVRTVPDATRLLQKLAARRGTSADLVGLQTAMGTWRMLRRRVELEKTMEERERGGLAEEWNALVGLMERMDGLEKLEERISLALQNANTNMDDLETSSTGGAADDGRELSQTSSSVEEQDPVFSAHGQWSIKPE
jgi:DNA mismatch repair ATPase MutS